jgi:hypothetical protein
MSELARELEEMMKRMRGDGLVPATVVSVDLDQFLFNAKDGAGNDYLDVRMNATTGKSGLIPVPVLNSSVLITDLGNQAQDWVMVMAGAVSEVYIVGAGPQVQSGVLGEGLNQNLTQLLTALTALTTALSAFAVANGAASAGVLLPLAPAYSALNAALPNVQMTLTQVTNQLINHLSPTVKLT